MLFVYREFLAEWIKNTLSDSIEEAQTEHDVYLDPRKYPLHESNFYLAEASGNFDLHDQFERKKNQKNIIFVFAFVVITFSFSRSIWFCVRFTSYSLSLCIFSMEFCIFYCFDFICFYFISIFYDLFFHFQLFSVDLYKSLFFLLPLNIYNKYLYAFFPFLCVCDNPHKKTKLFRLKITNIYNIRMWWIIRPVHCEWFKQTQNTKTHTELWNNLKKKQNTHNKLKWNANTLHLYIKNTSKLINTDQINLNKNLQYTKNYQLKPLHIKCEPVSLAKPKMRIPFTDFRIRNRTSVFNQYWCYVSI